MRIFYIYGFTYDKMKEKTVGVFDIAVKLIEKLGLSYSNCLFKINQISVNDSDPYKTLIKKYPQFGRFLLPSQTIAKYDGNTFNSRDIKNCLENWKPSDCAVNSSDIAAFSYIFTKGFSTVFCFNEIPWFGEAKPSLEQIGIYPVCSGMCVEKFSGNQNLYVSFEVDEKNHNVDEYIKRIEDELGCKYLWRKTDIYWGQDEKQSTEKILKEQRKLIKKLEQVFGQKFSMCFEKDDTKISVSGAIKKVIKGTDFLYEGTLNGCSDINFQDEYNNQINVFFDYYNRHLRPEINYKGAYFKINYKIQSIEAVASQSEVEQYISWVFRLVNDNLQIFEQLAKAFPLSPMWLKY